MGNSHRSWHQGLAPYERTIRGTAWLVVAAGVLVSVVMMVIVPPTHLIAALFSSAPLLFTDLMSLIPACVGVQGGWLVYRIGIRPLLAANRLLHTAEPFHAQITVSHDYRGKGETKLFDWYVDFHVADGHAAVPDYIAIVEPPRPRHRFDGLAEAALVYWDRNPHGVMVIHTSQGILVSAQ